MTYPGGLHMWPPLGCIHPHLRSFIYEDVPTPDTRSYSYESFYGFRRERQAELSCDQGASDATPGAGETGRPLWSESV